MRMFKPLLVVLMLALLGCETERKPATIADWTQQLEDILTVQQSEDLPGSVVRSRVCIAGVGEKGCAQFELERSPFDRLRTFTPVDGVGKASDRIAPIVLPYLTIEDGDLPKVHIAVRFPDPPGLDEAHERTKRNWKNGDGRNPRIAIVADGSLVFEAANVFSSDGANVFSPESDGLDGLRLIRPDSRVAVRLVANLSTFHEEKGQLPGEVYLPSHNIDSEVVTELSSNDARELAANIVAVMQAEAAIRSQLREVVVQ